jgi:hypothetical protein
VILIFCTVGSSALAKDVKVNFKSYTFTFKENQQFAFYKSESIAPGQIFIGDLKTNKVIGKMNLNWGQMKSSNSPNDCEVAANFVLNQARKKIEFTQKNLDQKYLCLATGLKASDGVSGFYIPTNTARSGILKPLLTIELSEGKIEDVAKWVKYE